MKARWCNRPAVTVAAFLALLSPASADLLISYDAATLSAAPAFLGDNLVSTNLTSSPAQAPIGAGNLSSGNRWFNEQGFDVTNRYFTFTVNPVAGYRVASLTNLTFVNARPNDFGPTNWYLRTSVDGFTANIGTDQFIPNIVSQGTHTSSVTMAIGTVNSPVEVRLYAEGATQSTGSWFIDDVAIYGSLVLIPEPSTAALWLIAAGALRFACRRKRAFLERPNT